MEEEEEEKFGVLNSNCGGSSAAAPAFFSLTHGVRKLASKLVHRESQVPSEQPRSDVNTEGSVRAPALDNHRQASANHMIHTSIAIFVVLLHRYCTMEAM